MPRLSLEPQSEERQRSSFPPSPFTFTRVIHLVSPLTSHRLWNDPSASYRYGRSRDCLYRSVFPLNYASNAFSD